MFRWVAAVLCAPAVALNRKPSDKLTKYLPDPALEFELANLDSEMYAPAPAFHQNIPFKNIKGNDLKLDIHMPNEVAPNKSLPALFYFHSGSWLMFDKTHVSGSAHRVLDEGYALISVDYRLVSQPGKWGGAGVTWPAQGEDAADAVKFIKTHGSKYGIDTNRLGCWGDSAGGQLCAWLASAGAMQSSTELSVAVVMFSPSCILCWPFGDVSDCSADWYFGFEKQTLKHLSEDKKNLSAEQTKQLELVYSAEATHWVYAASKKKTAPTFVGHGTKDTSVPQEKGIYFAKALKEAGVDHVLELVPGGEHEYKGWSDKTVDNAIKFVNGYMHPEK